MEKKNLAAELNKIAEEFKARLQRGAKLDKTVATGKFANSFKVKVKDDSIEISSDAEYAEYVINGALPSNSNAGLEKKKQGIESWIRAKGIRPYRQLKSGYKLSLIHI